MYFEVKYSTVSCFSLRNNEVIFPFVLESRWRNFIIKDAQLIKGIETRKHHVKWVWFVKSKVAFWKSNYGIRINCHFVKVCVSNRKRLCWSNIVLMESPSWIWTSQNLIAESKNFEQLKFDILSMTITSVTCNWFKISQLYASEVLVFILH